MGRGGIEVAVATGKGQGREPEWDDGLPEIDVEIPDDISELDRDVHAYQRETRRNRRIELARRFIPGLGRLGPYGVLAPIVAAALIVTAVLGSVMSLLGPRPGGSGRAGSSRGSTTAGSVTPGNEPGVGTRLPNAAVTVDGVDKRLSGLRSAVVLAMPARCDCAPAVDTVTSSARMVGVAVYLSGPSSETKALAAREGHYPRVLGKARNELDQRFELDGLSAVLVGRKGAVVDVVRDVTTSTAPTSGELRPLAPGP